MPTRRVTVQDHEQLQEVADNLAESKKVIVVTGAGISTNTGIPDFRSENGLYSLIQTEYDSFTSSQSESFSSQEGTEPDNSQTKCSQNSSQSTASSMPSLPSNVKGKDLFDSRIWNDEKSTAVFYRFIASLRTRVKQIQDTTATHKFIQSLRDGGRLVRCYTQNIDGLESRDGLCTNINRGKGNRARLSKKVVMQHRPEQAPAEGSEMDGGCEVVQLHGDLQDLRCRFCHAVSSWEEDDRYQSFWEGEAPTCPKCAGNDEDRQKRGRRSIGVGSLRPNVVLYGEPHPASHLISEITEHDLSLAPDALIIMGTSLRVHGLKVLIREFAKAIRCRKDGGEKVIFVNLSRPSESIWGDVIDYWVEMDCDQWVEDLRSRRSDIWTRQGDPRPKKKRKRIRAAEITLKTAKTLDDAISTVIQAAQALVLIKMGLPVVEIGEGGITQKNGGKKRKRRKADDAEGLEKIDGAKPSKRRSVADISRSCSISLQLNPLRLNIEERVTEYPSTPTAWKRFDHPCFSCGLDSEQAYKSSKCDLHMPVPTPPASARSSLTVSSPVNYSREGLAYGVQQPWTPTIGDERNGQPHSSKIIQELERFCEDSDHPPPSDNYQNQSGVPASRNTPSWSYAPAETQVSAWNYQFSANVRTPKGLDLLPPILPLKQRRPEVDVFRDMASVDSEAAPAKSGSFFDVVLCEKGDGGNSKRERRPTWKAASGSY